MRATHVLSVAAVTLLLVLWYPRSGDVAAVNSPAALAGAVHSREEGPMEGVLVTARADGAKFSVTVASDERGRYSVPARVLQPGHYTISTRAVGYDQVTAGRIDVAGEKEAKLDLTLQKTKDLSSQLTTLEWMMSVPGTPDQKDELARQTVNCGFCHTLERVVKSRYTADQWDAVIRRMSTYFPDGTGLRRHQKYAEREGGPLPMSEGQVARTRKLAEYLASINLSGGRKTWDYELKTLPRPKGLATRAIITEYDLPKQDSVPHDLDVDSKGTVWYGDAGWNFIGKLDPRSATFTEYPVPGFMPGNPLGVLDVAVDTQDNLWPAYALQGQKIAKFDTKTEKMTFWDLPNPQKYGNGIAVAFMMPSHNDADGKVWMTDLGTAIRLTPATGQIEVFNVFDKVGGRQGHMIYQISADSKNNCYFMDAAGANIGRIDAKTRDVKFYPVPTPKSYPRRGAMDAQDRLWFGEFLADKIGMFDTKTERFQEWVVPFKYIAPYYAAADRNGDVWVSGNQADRLLRLNPKTGKIVDYLLPRYSDSRRLAVDTSTDRVTIWLPNKNNASIIRVEALQ